APLRPGSVHLLLRCLATLVAAGVPLARSLELLAAQAEDRDNRRALACALKCVQHGSPLSAAFQQASPSFSAFQIRMLRVAENTGGMVEVLQRLADYEEGRRNLTMRLRSALAYPALLFAVCSLLLLVGPPFLLRGARQFGAQLGVEPSLAGRLALEVSSWLGNPLVVASLMASLVGAGWALRGFLSRPAGWRLLASLPILGGMLRQLALVRFSEAMALQLRVGVSVLEAAEHAVHLSQDPVLRQHHPAIQAALRDGEPLSSSLTRTGFFPGAALSSLAAGEEVGKQSDALAWVSRMHRLELDFRLDTLLAALEPAMLLFMGILAALVALITLEPMLQVVEKL
ncbi:MAG: type II secretion system F family protein, partial [Candidatus Eremiobacterota bacterium]